MIKVLLSLTVGLLWVSMAGVQAEPFVEGQHYTRITPPALVTAAPGKVEVVEVFWYGCPHCNEFEPYLEMWLKDKPPQVEFHRLPAPLNPRWTVHARTYYALESLGEIDRLHEALFAAMHNQGRRLDTLDAIARFLAQQGIDEARFRAAYNSPEVDGKVQQAATQVRHYGVNGVPSVVVNGKYRTAADMAGGDYGTMIKVIDELIHKEAAQSGAN